MRGKYPSHMTTQVELTPTNAPICKEPPFGKGEAQSQPHLLRTTHSSSGQQAIREGRFVVSGEAATVLSGDRVSRPLVSSNCSLQKRKNGTLPQTSLFWVVRHFSAKNDPCKECGGRTAKILLESHDSGGLLELEDKPRDRRGHPPQPPRVGKLVPGGVRMSLAPGNGSLDFRVSAMRPSKTPRACGNEKSPGYMLRCSASIVSVGGNSSQTVNLRLAGEPRRHCCFLLARCFCNCSQKVELPCPHKRCEEQGSFAQYLGLLL